MGRAIMRNLWRISLGLFVAAELFILAAIGWDALPLVVLWAVAYSVVALVARSFRRPLLRITPVGLLLVAAPVLAFEGGLFFVPALAVLLVAALRAVNPTGRLLEGRR